MAFASLPFRCGLRLHEQQAEDLLAAWQNDDQDAVRLVRENHPRFLDDKVPWLPRTMTDADAKRRAELLPRSRQGARAVEQHGEASARLRFMGTLTRCALLLGLAALSTAAMGQVTIRAITRSGLRVSANANAQGVPSNTDITAGRTVSATYNSANASSSASTTFAVSRRATSIDVSLTEMGTASSIGQIEYGGASVGLVGGNHTIDIELSSPTPTTLRAEVGYCTSNECCYGGSLVVPGHGSIDLNPIFGPRCPTPGSRVIDFGIGPIPTTLVFSTSGLCQTGHGSGSARFQGQWTISLSPSTCAGSAYGTPCGTSLRTYATLAVPGVFLELVDSSGPSAAFLLLGTQRLAIGIENCVLYTNYAVIVPFTITAPDRALVYLVPPPYPVQVTLQGATLGAGGFHMSNGLELQCR